MIRILLFLIVLLISGIGQAIEMKDINVAIVPVTDRSHENLKAGFLEAFQAVLIKMSGNTSIMTIPLIQEALSRVNNYVKNYQYQELPDSPAKALRLRVSFDSKGLSHLLSKANQAIWGNNRPLTLIWLSIPDWPGRHVLGQDMNHPAILALKEIAAVRGIPILFPIMDLEDQDNVRLHIESTLPMPDQIKAIFQRYGVDSILTGSITVVDNQHVEGEWRLFLNDKPYEWQTSAPDMIQVVKNGLDRAADMMTIQFAKIESRGMRSNVLLQVHGVYSLIDYVHVLATLKRLTPISEIYVSDMTADTILLQITTAGGVNELVESLKNISHFVLEGRQTEIGPDTRRLFYRWMNTTSVQPQ